MFEDFDWSQIALFTGDFADFAHDEDLINSILCIVCVLCAGLAAGLTMGLLSLDVTKLEIKAMTGSEVDRADAEAILPIVKKHHLLLVTLLLFNSMANEALPVFLSALVPEWLSVLISVTLVLIFGEILPSAFFTGRAQLHTAATMIPFVKGLTFFFWPIGYPLSLCLDLVFGVEEESSVITREELGALVFLQNSDRVRLSSKKKENDGVTKDYDKLSPQSLTDGTDSEENSNIGLSMYEINIMTGMLKLAKLKVADSMIKTKQVFMISDSTRLDKKTLENILFSGFSRIPVFRRRDKQHIIGYLLIKSLILVSADDKVPVENLPIRIPFFVKPDLGLLEMLAMFREGRCHLALVTEDPTAAMKCMQEGKRPTENCMVIGIVTLEDVIEEILQGEITDETDAIPSVFPIRSGTSTGPMGILSMGRSTVMRKTPSSKSITIGEDKGAKLVKKTVNYANHSSTRKSASGNKRNSSIANTNKITDTENASRKNWQQRCARPNVPELAYCAMKTSYSRERDGILERAGGLNLPYGSISNDEINDHIELNERMNGNHNNDKITASNISQKNH